MAIRLQQRTILLGSLVAAVISLGVIGYQLVSSWMSDDGTQAVYRQPMPAAASKPKPKMEMMSQQVKKPEQKPEIKSEIKPEPKQEQKTIENQPSASLIKKAEAATEAQDIPKKEPEKTKQSQISAKSTPTVLAKATEPKEVVEEKPKRPYEETLPADIYEPPAIKIPTRKPKAPKARRIKGKSKHKRVRSSRLSPLKHSQLPPWRRYAARNPFTKKDKGKPKIVIVIDDLGIDRRRTKKIIALPGPLTLSFLTYANALYKQTRAARKAGHEIMLHVAMEPTDMKNDPGPKVLLRDLEPDELEKRLIWGLGRLHRYVGINNHMGSKFTTDRYGMTIVMKELHRRGLLFLDSRTASKSVGAVIAHAIGVPYAERNIFLDNVNKLKAVQDRLAELERLARRKGKAIAIGHPRDATIEALGTWLNEVKTRGFVIVPITTIVHVPKLAG